MVSSLVSRIFHVLHGYVLCLFDLSVGPRGVMFEVCLAAIRRLMGAYFAYKCVLLCLVLGWPARVAWPPALGFILAVKHICPMHVLPVIVLY